MTVRPSVLQQEFGLGDVVDAKSLADVCRSSRTEARLPRESYA